MIESGKFCIFNRLGEFLTKDSIGYDMRRFWFPANRFDYHGVEPVLFDTAGEALEDGEMIPYKIIVPHRGHDWRIGVYVP